MDGSTAEAQLTGVMDKLAQQMDGDKSPSTGGNNKAASDILHQRLTDIYNGEPDTNEEHDTDENIPAVPTESDLPNRQKIETPKPPEPVESPEAAQRRIDIIHVRETDAVTRKILRKKTATITEAKADAAGWEKAGSKYKNILDIQVCPDGKIPYTHSDGTTYDHYPVNKDGVALYVVKEDNGEWRPSNFTNPNAVQITAVTEKHGDTITCTDSNGTVINNLRIVTLIDAQMNVLVHADDAAEFFSPSELTVMKAYNHLAQTGETNKITELYLNDAVDIKEAARNNGYLSADAVSAYLDRTYEEIKESPDKPLTEAEQEHNRAMQTKKADIRKRLSLDARVIADEQVMIGVAMETNAQTVDNMRKAIDAATDPTVKKNLQDAISMIESNKEKFPEVIQTVMSDMTPEFAKSIDESMTKGSMAEVYKKLIEKYPHAEAQIEDIKAKLGEKIVIGGLGLVALLIAIVGTAAASGIKPSR